LAHDIKGRDRQNEIQRGAEEYIVTIIHEEPEG
jgi:hypothetical protein